MKKLKIDWFKAKRDFLLDYFMSLKDVAVKYGFSYSKIKKVSAVREWHKDKKQIQKLLSDALMKEVEFKIAEEIAGQRKKIKPSLGEKYWRRRGKLFRQIAYGMGLYEPKSDI